jgi:hypothetical protein
MSIAVRDNTIVAIETEVTEGTYVAPSGASSFLQTLSDGFEMTPSKELVERNIFTGSIGKVQPRTGMRSVAGSIPVEARANSTEGSEPEFDKLMRSALGARRQNTTTVTTKASGNTATVLQIEDADISKFAVGDIVMSKGSGAYHVSPVTAVDTTGSAANITLLVAHPDGDHDDSVTVSKFTTYYVADSGHPSLSITKYAEDAVREMAVGCKVTSLSLENFTTGQIPSFNFGFEGLTFDRSLTAPAYTPSYNSALPPIVLDARAYMDGTEITINELTFSLENTLGFQTAISEQYGKASSRVTERVITGSFNPYKLSDSIANYTKFVDNTAFSLFAYAQVPTGTTGEFGNVIAVYMPSCLITELGEADQDGLLQEAVSFSANRGSSGSTNEIYIGFI